MNLLDLLFPKRCVSCGKFGDYICADCFSKIEFVEYPVCPVCSRQAIGGKTHPVCRTGLGLDGLIVACRYRGVVRQIVKAIKYKFAFDVAGLLVELVAANMWRFSVPQNFVLVPVPLSERRQNWRGFNQAQVLSAVISRQYKVKAYDLLLRNRETKTQVGLDRESRNKNVRGAFSLKQGASVIGKNIILVDDVYTTGATLAEAAKVLKRAGAGEVWAMAVALD